MNLSFETQLLLVLLIGIIAQATGVDLANNTNILLLLLLALAAFNQNSAQTNCLRCCNQSTYV